MVFTTNYNVSGWIYISLWLLLYISIVHSSTIARPFTKLLWSCL